jgi:hypothetical protein
LSSIDHPTGCNHVVQPNAILARCTWMSQRMWHSIMMKRRVGTISHIGIWITKDTSGELISHARSWLLWRRWRRRCIKCGTLLTKVTTKLRVKPHVRGASVGSKWVRGIKVLIVGISLLKWSRRVTLSFLGARRGRSLIWI